jgi:beta-barrel assembly-enhancing protease
MNLFAKTLVLTVVCALPCALPGQTTGVVPCTVQVPNFSTNAPNIFNDRQEQDLGDALAEMFEAGMRLADPSKDDELTRIGEKLLAQLPPTGIKYHFRMYDSGDINAFSITGGRVYVSRKLITAVKNEDELAGVLAHELGHLSMHQTAIDLTSAFKVRLGVTQVGDRADVFAKVHQYFSTPAKPYETDENEAKNEIVADHVAIYALVRAGYAPASFPSFLNDVMTNKGKTGNLLSDVFGLTHQDSKRYREVLQVVNELPHGCLDRKASSSDSFQAWQHGIVEKRVKSGVETAVGDKPVKLDPPVRQSPWRIRFSPDGNYVLVQDDSIIAVADANNRNVLFHIDAPDVNGAMFTPDSKGVVFNDNKLRVERWDIATGKKVDTKEMVVYDPCTQNKLTPDGKTLICLRAQIHGSEAYVALSLFDVELSKPYIEKPNFYGPIAIDYSTEGILQSSLDGTMGLVNRILSGRDFASVQIDPEGRHLLIVVADHAEAFDLEKRQQIQLEGRLKGLANASLTFLGPDKIYLIDKSPRSSVPYKAAVLSFPDGNVLNETSIGDQSVHGATKGDMVVAGPFKDFATGIVDPATTKIVAGWQFPTADVWNKYLAAETAAGGLYLGHIGANDGTQMSLPLGPMPGPTAGSFSPDGKYLVVALRGRSAVWDVTTGKQINLMRPITYLWIDDQDHLFAMLPKFVSHDPTEIEVDLGSPNGKELGKPEDNDRQHENTQYIFRSMGKNTDLRYHATLEVKSMETQKILWSHGYPHESPVCWPSDDGRIVLAWDLSVDTAKSEVKKYPKLQEQTKGFTTHKQGLLIETLDGQTGAPLEQVALPEIDLSSGWNDERYARVAGEFVLVNGEHGNTAIYRFDTGAKVGEFFGSPVATDAARGLIAAVNRDDEILLVDEKTGKELQRFTLGSPVRLARIITGADQKLLVLTADQVVHQLPLPQ